MTSDFDFNILTYWQVDREKIKEKKPTHALKNIFQVSFFLRALAASDVLIEARIIFFRALVNW